MLINIIVFSYNRPRMLREAIASVLNNSTHEDVLCWVLDDGSDFDVLEIQKEMNDDRLIMVVGEKITPERRAADSIRFAENVNAVLDEIPRGQGVGYLCDDDFIGEHFAEYCSTGFENNPHLHLMSADAYYFFEGENPYTDSVKGFRAPEAVIDYYMQNRNALMWWSVGNFMHLSDCFHDEDLRWVSKTWGDKKAHSWDVDFIAAVHKLHATHIHFEIPGVYRREHENMLSARLGRLNADPLAKDARYAFEAKDITPEMVTGMME